MAEAILYSIVVPIYGVEKYLKQCVDSLIGQTYYNIEIILVDDGAKDRSAEICDHYAQLDPRVKVLHKKNGGLVSARKAGAQIATGDYILCVDGDDWVSTDYIRQLDEAIRLYQPDVVCCGYVQTDGVTEHRCTCEAPQGNYRGEDLQRCIYPIAIESPEGIIFSPHVWAKAFKRELYLPEQLAVADVIKIGEDGAVVKPILTKAESVCLLDACLYYYRINQESMTKDHSAYDWNGPRHIYRHLQQQLDLTAFDFQEQLYRCIARLLYTIVFSQFNRQEKYRIIKKDIKAQLRQPDYRQVLEKAQYTSLKTRLEVFLLKHRLLLPIYLLHKVSK